MQLHWREEPALALVTYQGAKVLDYKLVELKQGSNKLSVPMTAKLAPNFELSVIVMTDTRAPKKDGEAGAGTKGSPGATPAKPIVRFHTAASHFRVARDLKITLETKRKAGAKGAIRPGEELELVIKATDPQGKPVTAELSVAMVEQSLLAMFGSHVSTIDDFFAGSTREITVRSGSSITFAYNPTTRPIDRQLLAEAERIEIAAEESARLAATDRIRRGGMRLSAPPQDTVACSRRSMQAQCPRAVLERRLWQRDFAYGLARRRITDAPSATGSERADHAPAIRRAIQRAEPVGLHGLQ